MIALYRNRKLFAGIGAVFIFMLAYGWAWNNGKRAGDLRDAQEQIEGGQDAQENVDAVSDLDDSGILERLRRIGQ